LVITDWIHSCAHVWICINNIQHSTWRCEWVYHVCNRAYTFITRKRLKSTIPWAATLCSSVQGYQSSSEMSVDFYRTIRCYNLEHHNPQMLSIHLFSKILKISKARIMTVILHTCDIWSLTSRDEHKLKMSENKAVMQIFWLKDEVNNIQYYITKIYLWFIQLPTSVQRWWNVHYDEPDMWLRWERSGMIKIKNKMGG
jgi:hypothetical protein